MARGNPEDGTNQQRKHTKRNKKNHQHKKHQKATKAQIKQIYFSSLICIKLARPVKYSQSNETLLKVACLVIQNVIQN